jgi:hypothetical protein
MCMHQAGPERAAAELLERALAEWQKAVPADYEADKVSEIDAQLKTLKKRTRAKNHAGLGETAVSSPA